MFCLKRIHCVTLLATISSIMQMNATFSQYKSFGVFKDFSFILNIFMLFVMEINAALLVAELNVSLSLGLSSINP